MSILPESKADEIYGQTNYSFVKFFMDYLEWHMSVFKKKAQNIKKFNVMRLIFGVFMVVLYTAYY